MIFRQLRSYRWSNFVKFTEGTTTVAFSVNLLFLLSRILTLLVDIEELRNSSTELTCSLVAGNPVCLHVHCV